MSSNSEIDYSNNESKNICFYIMLLIGAPSFIAPEFSFITLPIIMFSSAAYFIYFLISEGHASEIVWGILKGFLIIIIASIIPFIGPIILIGWIIYNIAKAVDSIKSLFPEAVFSIILYACLAYPLIDFLATRHEVNYIPRIIAGLIYIVVAFNYNNRLKKQASSTKDQLFKLSLMWISAPLIAILIITIVSAVRSAFRTVISTTTSPIRVTQNVSGYVRGDTIVSNYTREVSRTITTTTTSILPGAGAMTASVAGNLTPKQQNTTSPELPEVTYMSLAKVTEFETNKDQHFYHHSDLDNKKITHFFQKAMNVLGEPLFNKNDIRYYFDETVFGKGDHGVVLTEDGVYCVLSKLYDSFYLPYDDIENVIVKGKISKEIVITDKNNEIYTITLTQSNKGAEKIAQLIREFSCLS